MRIDVERILLEIEQLPDYDTQIALQTVEGYDHTYGVGRVTNLKHRERLFKHFCFPELSYTNSVIESLGMFRTRLMSMEPRSCYTYHKDTTKRIHIPLITNNAAFMVIEDKCYWYPADGNYYLADTTKFHTFVNGHRDQHRLHIVGNIK